jgi:hypothetical protein
MPLLCRTEYKSRATLAQELAAVRAQLDAANIKIMHLTRLVERMISQFGAFMDSAGKDLSVL